MSEQPDETPSEWEYDAPEGKSIEERDEAAELRDQIYELRMVGYDHAEIAATCGVTVKYVKATLTSRMQVELSEIGPAERQGLVQLEVDRLDKMFKAHWFAAIQGDIDSTKAALAIMKQRVELLRLNQIELNPAGITNNVLVIGGSEAEFLAGLEAQHRQIQAAQIVRGARIEDAS